MRMKRTAIRVPSVALSLGIAAHTAGLGGCSKQAGGKRHRNCPNQVHQRKEISFCLVELWCDEMSGIWDDCNE